MPPIGFELTGEYFWQVHVSGWRWRDVDHSWNEPLFRALRAGVPQIRLPSLWYNRRQERLTEWYTINFTSPNYITQEHDRTRTVRELRPVQLVTATGMYTPCPPDAWYDAPPLVTGYYLQGPYELPCWQG